MVEEEKIVNYVKYVIKHPMEDLYMASVRFFTPAMLSHEEKDLVIPELLQLTPAKRTLVIDIVKSKTNYDISSSKNNFHNFMMIKEVGHIIHELTPENVPKKFKWLIK